MKDPLAAIVNVAAGDAVSVPTEPKGLFSLTKYDRERRTARFSINTQSEKYQHLVSGHRIAQTAAICPATLMVDMAIEALTGLIPELSNTAQLLPQIQQVTNQAALCIDDARTVVLDIEAVDAKVSLWSWKILSSGSSDTGVKMEHVSGQLAFVPASDVKTQSEFKRYERLTGYHAHCAALLNNSTGDADDVIHGTRNIYRAFSAVVDYAAPFQGLQRLVGRHNESAGRVVKTFSGETWLDTLLSDCFSQVAGIWVNCMTDTDPLDMYIATGFERWARRPGWTRERALAVESWDVLVRHERADEKIWISDIFVFDPSGGGQLVEIILGVNYHRVSKASMARTLARLTPGLQNPVDKAEKPVIHEPVSNTAVPARQVQGQGQNQEKKPKIRSGPPAIDVEGKLCAILADISGLEPAEITAEIGLADMGIDSLMGMELGREMEGAFQAKLMSDELAAVVTMGELVAHVSRVLGVEVEGAGGTGNDDGSLSDVSDQLLSASSGPGTGVSTPPETAWDLAEVAREGHGSKDLHLPPSLVFAAFEETKQLTDKFIEDYRCADYMDTILPLQTHLCVVLAVEALETLGCHIRSAEPGEILPRIPHTAEHVRLVRWLYDMLEKDARLVEVDPVTGVIRRTSISSSAKASNAILEDLLKAIPDHEWANRLTYFAGHRLADVLRGKQDGVKLLFGTDEGRELVTSLYGDSLLNKLANVQMQDILTRLVSKLTTSEGPLRIMELGAGTGGTTKGMVRLLASLGMPIEYTFTDLSGSFVATARKNIGKEYPFMKFRVHDIEKPPAAELLGSQHVVIASNAIHATHSLRTSLTNIRKALRPDGFLLMLEMTSPLRWVDMIFGLFQGWWLFDDGREHAISHQTRWRDDLHASGYGRVDWTDGWRPETEIQRVIVAQASPCAGFPIEPTSMKFEAPVAALVTTTEEQIAQLDGYVRKYTADFEVGTATNKGTDNNEDVDEAQSVVITGTTGSLGAHLVAHLASLSTVKTVTCLNRRSMTFDASPEARQNESFTSRGIHLSPDAKAKLRVIACDHSKPHLGVDTRIYDDLVLGTTHIVHNAWPMTGKRPVAGLEAQFAVMRNLIDLCRDASGASNHTRKVTFQFISSIAVMGYHSLLPGNSRFAPEARASVAQLLPNGYAHAKWVCERMLDETLHKHHGLFRVTTLRLGQIAGNSATGYWNENEQLPFLLKSSQTLGALPRLEGDMCWTPVEKVAGAAAELLLLSGSAVEAGPVYHVDNTVRQPWAEVLPVLARELAPRSDRGQRQLDIIPFPRWVARVRGFPGSVEDNPAARLIDFLDDHFLRMSCGGMLLATENACRHSETLRGVGPVGAETLGRYVKWWKERGFLA